MVEAKATILIIIRKPEWDPVFKDGVFVFNEIIKYAILWKYGILAFLPA